MKRSKVEESEKQEKRALSATRELNCTRGRGTRVLQDHYYLVADDERIAAEYIGAVTYAEAEYKKQQDHLAKVYKEQSAHLEKEYKHYQENIDKEYQRHKGVRAHEEGGTVAD